MNNYVKGCILTIVGGTMWGFSGTCGQYLLQVKGLTSDWLVPVRLTSAGIILLLICFFKEGRHVFRIWKDPKDVRDILIFGAFGMSMCQYTYFTAIGFSNAGTATVLQYIGPVLIMIYVSAKNLKLPGRIEVVAIAFALAGTFLLATHGNINSLTMSKEALIWGLLSAVALAVYTVWPGQLLQKFGSMSVTAWGMLVGGILLCLLFRPWNIPVFVDAGVAAGMTAVILIGTVAAFACYMEGVRCIGPKRGSLFAAIEPVSATVFSVLWMHVSFEFMDLLGFACIVSTIFLLSSEKGKTEGGTNVSSGQSDA